MNTEQILEFLMENDIILKCNKTGICMTADEAFQLGGEFVVYSDVDIYRGLDFEKAIRHMQKEDE